MGIGDELLAAGEARKMRTQTGQRCRITDKHDRPRHHECWVGNDDVVLPDEPGHYPSIRNHPGNRPYIDAARSTKERWAWRDFQPTPARLPTVKPNEAFRGYVYIEPSIKAQASPNKQWHQWAELVRWRDDLKFVMCAHPATPLRPLPGVRAHATPTIWEAWSVLAACRAAVLHEGGMHHAAAALGVPATVIFGGYISPAQTGYHDQHSIFTGGIPCGSRRPCRHCDQAMRAITVPIVNRGLDEQLAKTTAR